MQNSACGELDFCPAGKYIIKSPAWILHTRYLFQLYIAVRHMVDWVFDVEHMLQSDQDVIFPACNRLFYFLKCQEAGEIYLQGPTLLNITSSYYKNTDVFHFLS